MFVRFGRRIAAPEMTATRPTQLPGRAFGPATRERPAAGSRQRGASSTGAAGRAHQGLDRCRRAGVGVQDGSPSGHAHGRRQRQLRHNRGVRVERNRENVFTVTATGQELSALIAGARLALDAMHASPDAPADAIELLGRVLDEFDRSRQQLSESPPNGDRH